VRLDRQRILTVEADMTDIGTGSDTIVQQTAAGPVNTVAGPEWPTGSLSSSS
jgi:CO/xanthine dehydrogenase Mo-binding subunit